MKPNPNAGPANAAHRHYKIDTDGGVLETDDPTDPLHFPAGGVVTLDATGEAELLAALQDPQPIKIFDRLNAWAGPHGVPAVQEAVDHPKHYGGVDNPYEVIKVIEAWDPGFHLGNTIKYVARAGRKGSAIEDLQKARWYLDREIQLRISRAATEAGDGQGSRT